MGRENSSSRRRSGGKNENKKRKSKKEEESDNEEDEQMETDDDSKEEKNEEGSKGEDEESGSDSDSDEEEPVIEYMVANRARRGNAGAKMSQLIEETLQEDDFYKSAYGGFAEEDADAEYVSPNQSDDDEVDSDFDRPEDEEEPTSDTEGKVPLDPERKRKKDLLKKNKWVLSRIAGFGVKANVVDDVTQAQFLKEAEKTEKANLESLRRYEQFELEKKKKREKSLIKVRPQDCVTIFDDGKKRRLAMPTLKVFHKQRVPVQQICAVTGRHAKYRDPVTGLPYSSTFAFRVIRDKYDKYLKNHKNATSNKELAEYLQTLE